jgi:hypothetical protein
MELLDKHVYMYERKFYIASADSLKVHQRPVRVDIFCLVQVVLSELRNEGNSPH